MVVIDTARRLAGAGWIPAKVKGDEDEVWTYYTYSTSFNYSQWYVSGDVTDKYSKGMKIRLDNAGGTDYYILIDVDAYDSGNDRTKLTGYGGTDYQLADSAITNMYYSSVKAPFGFPLDPLKWTQTHTTGSTQASPVSGTFYNLGGSINIPVGSWNVTYKGMVYCYGTGNNNLNMYVIAGLSTANNTQGDTEWSAYDYLRLDSGHAMDYYGAFVSISRPLTIATSDIYYLNCSVTYNNACDTMDFFNDTLIATCAYL